LREPPGGGSCRVGVRCQLRRSRLGEPVVAGLYGEIKGSGAVAGSQRLGRRPSPITRALEEGARATRVPAIAAEACRLEDALLSQELQDVGVDAR
jgi:hypothetical protein